MTTIVSQPSSTTDSAALVADFGGSDSTAVDYMIGVGLVKDSDAVFFQYQGDDAKQALMQPNGKPVTRLNNVVVTGVSVADDVYENKSFKGVKLNLFVRTQSGHNVMLTSGLTTLWSQCIVTALMGLYAEHGLNSLVNIDTWKGNSNMGTCFAAIRNNGRKVSSQAMYDDLYQARSNNRSEIDLLMRNAIALLSAALNEDAVIDVPEAANAEIPGADF